MPTATAATTIHFLDTLPLDFARPGVQELWQLLRATITDKKLIRQLMASAGMSGDLVDTDQPIRHLWHDVLTQARNQARLHALLDVIEAEPAYSAAAARVHALRQSEPAVEPKAPSRDALAKGAWREQKERITGSKNTLRDISFLAQGTSHAKSVARLRVWYPSDGDAAGTGFLIAPDLVLTNHHVLYLETSKGQYTKANHVEVWLQYERDMNGTLPQHIIASGKAETIDGDPDDDWAVVRLAEPVSADFPILSLTPKNPVHVGDDVYIIQHPGGDPKQISLGHNEVRFTDERLVQYLTDTQGGSSGSPVFNTRWEVVALHHMWTDAETADGKVEIRNEGIRIERVARALKSKGFLP